MVAQLTKNIKPKKPKAKEVKLRILNELRKEGKVVRKEFEKTTTIWKGAKPTFEVATNPTGDNVIIMRLYKW